MWIAKLWLIFLPFKKLPTFQTSNVASVMITNLENKVSERILYPNIDYIH